MLSCKNINQIFFTSHTSWQKTLIEKNAATDVIHPSFKDWH